MKPASKRGTQKPGASHKGGDLTQGTSKTTSKAQKSREKKKLAKVAEKRNKQSKLNGILDTLRKQEEERTKLQENVGNDTPIQRTLLSSKDIGGGKRAAKRREKEKKYRERLASEEQECCEEAQHEEEEVQEKEETEESEQEDKREQIVAKGYSLNSETKELQATQSHDYLQKIKDMFSNKKRKKSSDQGDAEEELRATKVVEDKRIKDINLADQKYFGSQFISESDQDGVTKNSASTDIFAGDRFKRKHKRIKGLNQDDEVKLPVVFSEREIMENIENNIVTIICGETGSGKSTQIPQFILKAANASAWKFRCSNEKVGVKRKQLLIGITQPRRVAAVSLAKRVSEELGTELGQEVGYQIRYDSEYFSKDKTMVKFMTDGILLKEIESDFYLRHYSVIVIDEAHERSLNSDILISLLTRIAHARCAKALQERQKNVYETFPLRLVIMSATLRVSDFRENSRLFPLSLYEQGPPNFIKVDARQFPVTVHYNKVTREDYVEQAYKKVLRIHKQLPYGGILVFLTGKKEIQYLQRRLKIALQENSGHAESHKTTGQQQEEDDDEDEENFLENVQFDKQDATASGTESKKPTKVLILPLYSQLSPDKQYRVFQNHDEDKDGNKQRLIVLSTNVAETSLTIPNIRYVVDSGRSKEKVYDNKLSMSSFKVQWISQASAEQRAGRAGRTAPGHCYRLFSAAVFSKLADYSKPEILKTPLEQTMLQLKSIGVEDLVRFPYVTKPTPASIHAAIKQLTILGAFQVNDKLIRQDNSFSGSVIPFKADNQHIDEVLENTLFKNFENAQKGDQDGKQGIDPTEITPLGTLLSKIPLDPRCSKILIVASKYNLLHYAILMVATMTVSEIHDTQSSKKYILMQAGQSDLQEAQGPGTSEHSADEEDPDLQTTLDRQRSSERGKERIKRIKEQNKFVAAEIRKQRAKYWTGRSEIISDCRVMCAYFSYVNCEENRQRARQELARKKSEVGLGDEDDILAATKGGSFDFKVVEFLIEEFCEQNFLLVKAIKEVHFLSLQLEKMMKEDIIIQEDKQYQVMGAIDFSKSQIKMPKDSEEKILQQAILAGLIENFSRQITVFDQQGNVVENQQAYKKGSKILFESQSSRQRLKLHHQSPILKAENVKKDDMPEYLVYQEVYALSQGDGEDGEVKTNYYMKGVTRIEDLSWINNLGSDLLVQRSQPIHERCSRQMSTQTGQKELLMAKTLARARTQMEQKKGKKESRGEGSGKASDSNLITLDTKTNKIMIYSQLYYGKQMWKLNVQFVPLEMTKRAFYSQSSPSKLSLQYYSFFAYFLLRGQVVMELKDMKSFLKEQPVAVLDDGNMSEKVTTLLGWLQKFNVDSKDELVRMWKQTNPYYLHDAILLWVDPRKQVNFKQMWSQMIKML